MLCICSPAQWCDIATASDARGMAKDDTVGAAAECQCHTHNPHGTTPSGTGHVAVTVDAAANECWSRGPGPPVAATTGATAATAADD